MNKIGLIVLVLIFAIGKTVASSPLASSNSTPSELNGHTPLPRHLISFQFNIEQPGLLHFEMVWREGNNPLNQFRINRIISYHSFWKPLKPVVFVSPFNVTSEHYSLTSTDEYQHSIEAQLALAGFDTWVVEDRTFTYTPDACNTGLDCSVMGEWGFNKRMEDIQFARQFIELATGVADPVIGGITGGGMAAIATVNRHPDDFRALFSTGAIYSNDPTTRFQNDALCIDYTARIANGEYYEDVMSDLLPLIDLAKLSPAQPSPVMPNFTNAQFLAFLLGTPGALGALSLTPEYRFATIDSSFNYQYMDFDLFYEDAGYFGILSSNTHFTDIVCSLAGDETHYQHLDEYRGDVLFLGGGLAMAPLQQQNATLFVNAYVTLVNNPTDGGEADNYLVPFNNRQTVLDAPLIDWLNTQY